MKHEYLVENEIVKIFLKRRDGKICEMIVDLDEFNKVLQYNVCARRDSSDNYYAKGRHKENPQNDILIHRLIMNAPKGMQVDHINHNTLDNRKVNLRIVTNQQNSHNKTGARSTNKTSGELGVSWLSVRNRWHVQVRVGGKKVYNRLFRELNDAIEASRKARKMYQPSSPEGREDIDTSGLLDPVVRNKTSGIKGIYWKERDKRWIVAISINKKKREFGQYKELEEAKKMLLEARELQNSLIIN